MRVVIDIVTTDSDRDAIDGVTIFTDLCCRFPKKYFQLKSVVCHLVLERQPSRSFVMVFCLIISIFLGST